MMSIDSKLTTQEGVISWRRGLLEVRQVYVTDGSSEVFCERCKTGGAWALPQIGSAR
jgi:hypothetical protein